MRGSKTIATLAILNLFSSSAWSAEPSEKKEIREGIMAVSNGNNEFATDLYSRLRSDKSTNLFFSPYSISTALAMTYAGAEGQTKSQMADVLHFQKQESELHASFKSLSASLMKSDDKAAIHLRVANRLWGQDGFHFVPEFLRVTNANYGVELGLLDFKQSEVARKEINSWVEEQTDHKIQNLIASGVLNELTRLVVTNAVYFKARWMSEFSKSLTTNSPFHVSASLKVDVPTMNQEHHFRYVETDQIQILELPYGHDSSLSMLILLPKTVDRLADLEKQISNENLQKWCVGLQSRNVKVQLPKFKTTSAFSLQDVLIPMGMSLAFSNNADFTRISTQEPLSISAVIHKAFIDVNEEGTEAAAATAVTFEVRSMPAKPQVPVVFRADHPFVFLIRHNRTQVILFIGRLVNPQG
jgi:serpin B